MRGSIQSMSATSDDFLVSRMTEHDLLEVTDIEESCSLSRWGWEAYHTELTTSGNALMFVARPSGYDPVTSGTEVIAGFVASRISDCQLHINNVAVRPTYRRRGLGNKLLKTVLGEGERLGACEALLEVRVGNFEAQALYKKNGFSPVGRRKNYYAMPAEDALVMRRLSVDFLGLRSQP